MASARPWNARECVAVIHDVEPTVSAVMIITLSDPEVLRRRRLAPAISETAKTVKPAATLRAVIFVKRVNFMFFASYL